MVVEYVVHDGYRPWVVYRLRAEVLGRNGGPTSSLIDTL